MNAVKLIATILFAATAQGCATGVLNEQGIRLSGKKGDFTIVRAGCNFKSATYVDRSGKGNSIPRLSFIAVSNEGQTLASWHASCDAVVPNGSSNCTVTGGAGAFDGGGGFGCPAFQNFRIVSEL